MNDREYKMQHEVFSLAKGLTANYSLLVTRYSLLLALLFHASLLAQPEELLDDFDVPRRPVVATDETVALLTGILEKEDLPHSERSAADLGDTNTPTAVQPLLAALGDERPTVRNVAIRSLAQLDAKSAGKPITLMFSDEKQDVMVRCTAALSLGRLGDTDSIKALAGPHDDASIHQSAMRALGMIGQDDDSVIEALTANHADVPTQLVALRSLRGIASPKALAALQKTSADVENSSVRFEALMAIEAVVLKSPQQAKSAEPAIRARLKDSHGGARRIAIRTLAELIGKAARKELIDALTDPEATVRAAAAHELGRLKMADTLPHLHEIFQDKHKLPRQEAVFAFVQIANEDARNRAAKSMTDDYHFARECGSQVLGGLKDDRHIDDHIALLEDPHIEPRRAAAMSLGFIGNMKAAEPLNLFVGGPQTIDLENLQEGDKLKSDNDALSNAGLSLARLEYKSAIRNLDWLLGNKVTGVKSRASAAWALGMLGELEYEGVNVNATLNGRLGDMLFESIVVRREAARAMGNIGSDVNVGVLKGHLQRDEGSIMLASAWSLRKITGDDKWQAELVDYQPRPRYFINALQ